MIFIKKINIVSNDGSVLGNFNIIQIITKVKKNNLDLIEVFIKHKIPICKIINFGKYRYHVIKKQRYLKKKQKNSILKEIKLRPNIEERDLLIKINSIKKIIQYRNKVKVSILFRGREMNYESLGLTILKKIKSKLSNICNSEMKIRKEKKQIFIVFLS